jgi:hypothetical protein
MPPGIAMPFPHHITGQSSNSPERASLMLYVITPNTGREESLASSLNGNGSLLPFSGFSKCGCGCPVAHDPELTFTAQTAENRLSVSVMNRR